MKQSRGTSIGQPAVYHAPPPPLGTPDFRSAGPLSVSSGPSTWPRPQPPSRGPQCLHSADVGCPQGSGRVPLPLPCLTLGECALNRNLRFMSSFDSAGGGGGVEPPQPDPSPPPNGPDRLKAPRDGPEVAGQSDQPHIGGDRLPTNSFTPPYVRPAYRRARTSCRPERATPQVPIERCSSIVAVPSWLTPGPQNSEKVKMVFGISATRCVCVGGVPNAG